MTIKAQVYTAQEALDAIRLALHAKADQGAQTRVVAEILNLAPDPVARDTRSVQMLLDAVRAAGAEFRVTDHEPHGKLIL